MKAGSQATVRRGVRAGERGAIEALLEATGFFNREELAVAMELVDDHLAHGEESHYRLLVAMVQGEVAGYACWGVIPGTAESADLYWIAVHPRFQRLGVGRALLADAEEWMAAEDRPRIYIETATRPQYAPTRAFYLGCGYTLAAELPDYYAPGDGKAIFVKLLTRGAPPAATPA